MALAAALFSSCGGGHASAEEVLKRGLRLQWAASKPVELEVRLQISGGTFAAPQNLSLDAASTGSFQLSPDGETFTIRSLAPIERGGVDLEVTGSRDSTISVAWHISRGAAVLEPAQADASTILRLADLGQTHSPIAITDGLRFWVQPTPGESIRADFGADSLVFWGDESYPLRIRLPPTLANTSAAQKLRLRVRKARGGRLVSESSWPIPAADANGQIEIDAGTLQMPPEEGAYDFEFDCLRPVPRNLPLLTGSSESVVRRIIQVVVVDKPDPAASDPPSAAVPRVASSPLTAGPQTELIGRIQPFGKGWSIPRIVPSVPQAFSGVSKLLVSGEEAVTSSPLGEESHAGEKVAVLPPGGWYAHPLPIAERDQPHVVIIRYPIGQAMRMGVSVVQQDAAGKIAPLGTDSGLATDVPVDSSNGQNWEEHRVVFWPHCSQPFLVLANHDTSEPARFASVVVEVVRGSLAESTASSFGPPRPAANSRLAALYLDKPLIAECFGDEGAFDPASNAVLEDWVTFLKSSQRLVDYLQWAGFNGAIITVSSEGGTLYPTDLFHATPRFDTGSFSSAGHDPVRKDILELLFRLFDRAGLRLVPAIELATPLPALERLRESSDTFYGIEPLDSGGRSLLTQRPPRNGLAPYYNPLDRRVQDQLIQSVAEVTQRYRTHRSFVGIGMHLGPQTYLQLPEMEWCRDVRTVMRFAAAHPEAPQEIASLQSWIDGEGRETFLAWRAEEMTRLYAHLADATQGRRLLLLTADSSLPVDTHRSKGLDWTQLSQLKNVVPMRLRRESIFRDAVQQSRDAHANENLQWDRTLASSPQAGGLVFRRPADLKISGFAERAPEKAGAKRNRWFSHAVPTGARYRRQLTGLFDQMDPQILAIGGWTVPWGQEHQLRETLQTFAALPATSMRTLPPRDGGSGNVRIRQVVTERGTIVSAVNLSPWSVDVEVVFDQAGEMSPLLPDSSNKNAGEESPAADLQMADGTVWRTTIASGALSAVKVNPPGCKVRHWIAQPTGGEKLVHRLNDRTRELASRVAVLSNPRPYPALRNGGFEEIEDPGRLAGWMHAQHPPGCVQLQKKGFESDRSVRLSNTSSDGAKTWIVSDAFQPPPTGRLAVSLQVRAWSDGGPAQDSATLRVAIEGWAQGVPLRRHVILTPKMDGKWQQQPLWLEVEDIGADDVQQLRLTIDLLSPGEVWLDDVRLYDFFLTETERAELQSRAFLAIERLRQGDLTPAAKLFDSHWGRYLMALRVQSPPQQGRITQEIVAEPEAGIADRLRKLLPTPMF